MCKRTASCMDRFFTNLIKFILAAGVTALFIAAVIPGQQVLRGTPSEGPYERLAASVIYAGIAESREGYNETLARPDSNVKWTQLSTAIACGQNTDIFELWAKPLEICKPCSGGYCYSTPGSIRGIQATTILTIIFAGITAILRFGAIFGATNITTRRIDFALCILTLAFAIASFALWKTTKVAKQLQSTGYVPVVIGEANGLKLYDVSPAVKMKIAPAFGFMIGGFIISFFSAQLSFVDELSSLGSRVDAKGNKKRNCCDWMYIFCCCWLFCLCCKKKTTTEEKNAAAPPPEATETHAVPAEAKPRAAAATPVDEKPTDSTRKPPAPLPKNERPTSKPRAPTPQDPEDPEDPDAAVKKEEEDEKEQPKSEDEKEQPKSEDEGTESADDESEKKDKAEPKDGDGEDDIEAQKQLALA